MTGPTRDAQDVREEQGLREERGVRGERTTALGSEVHTAQARLSGLLAAALVIALGLSALGWYYAHALTRASRTRQSAQASVVSRAQGEMTLPSLGAIDPPPAPIVASIPASPPDLPLEPRPSPSSASGGAGTLSAPGKPRRASALERRLAGVVFSRERAAPVRPATLDQTGSADQGRVDARPTVGAAEARRALEGTEGALTGLLRPGLTPAAAARLLPSQRFLLPRGAFIDCTLETAIDSTLPGMTTCVTAADTFGVDGKVVLLDRGTKLIGETRGQVQQGQARVFVLWTEARTPAGVVVPLDSPGTDELGRAGLPGEVQRHFWQRFGAAMLISLVDGAVQAGVQASARSGGTVVLTPSGSNEVLTEVLKDTLRIAPTVVKHNGDRIEVLVARDVDFRPVYELHVPAAGH